MTTEVLPRPRFFACVLSTPGSFQQEHSVTGVGNKQRMVEIVSIISLLLLKEKSSIRASLHEGLSISRLSVLKLQNPKKSTSNNTRQRSSNLKQVYLDVQYLRVLYNF